MAQFSNQPDIGGIYLGDSVTHPGVGFESNTFQDGVQEICTDSESHLITFAPTGSGKTWTMAIPTLLDYRGSVVAFDPKGELTRSTADARRAMGQEVVVLDPFGISGYETASLNPLDLMLSQEPTVENALCLATSIVNQISEADPFWDASARDLVAQLLLYIVFESPKALRNLTELNYLLNQSLKDMRLTIRDMARSKERVVSEGAYALPIEAERTMACILASARRFTEIFRSEIVCAVTKKSSFSVDVLDDEKPATIYLVLPPAYLRSHAALIRVWMETLIARKVSQKTHTSLQTLFLFDEAAQLGPMDFLTTSITLLRSYGVRCWTFWQDAQQLQACYPTSWQTIFNNCRYHLVFGRQSYLAIQGFEALYGRLNRALLEDGFIAELGEAPRAFLRPEVAEVLDRVASCKTCHLSENPKKGNPACEKKVPVELKIPF
ncbi:MULTISPECIES: type IV secretory system conjugative DNA transfer family protein [unclassified Ruegeria]|uniref:type IV secretory system conjugative DNA transfer family protein n=1 Tax=unclassified Ruegeria TaxID=2625375 RepID=UPI0014878CE1|nr:MULTISPECIES: type IV secretory system conjugative DNA transfer family protein [unclassified Ruegeria]